MRKASICANADAFLREVPRVRSKLAQVAVGMIFPTQVLDQNPKRKCGPKRAPSANGRLRRNAGSWVELSSHPNFQRPLCVMLAFERLAERGDAIQLKQAAVRRNDAQHDNRDEIGQACKQL
ncbi:hypothetical protein SAMN02927900_01782 [Rhizobium mongolense subsp. loessense]|uniref:Uncharacterized protein n=1 Tax=Rhizobium mongolense subsp. loessense TaxID=158890 RepID=A0A1G4QRV9_9HYPH|nr:hypothetical protein SAMN02927900_01782 [Rhizobium mongolense subsp. loessense]